MKMYTEVIWKMEDSGKLTQTSSKSEEYNGPIALCGGSGDAGDWGIFGTAAGSTARTASDLGFSDNDEYYQWMADRDVVKGQTKGGLDLHKTNISPTGEYYGLEDERFGAQSDYDKAVTIFEAAELAKDVGESEFGTFTGNAEEWSELSDEEKGSYFVEAGAELERDEMSRIEDLSTLESQRATMRGKALSASDKAEQARMHTGMQYSGGLEKNIRKGELSAEGLVSGTLGKEDIIQADWQGALTDYDDELIRIQNEWDNAKLNWETAYGNMYGETGELEKYQREQGRIGREGQQAIIEDTVLGGGIEDIKQGFTSHWNLDTKSGPSGMGWSKEHYTTGDVPFAADAGTWGMHQTGGYFGSMKMTGADISSVGRGYGGYGTQHEDLAARFELAKSIYGGGGDE